MSAVGASLNEVEKSIFHQGEAHDYTDYPTRAQYKSAS